MIVIGIDPGAANTGFGVVRTIGDKMVALDGGVIETAPDLPAAERLAKIHEGLRQLIVWHEPKAMALEDLFFGKNVGSALAVGQARGVAMLAAAQQAVPVLRLHAAGGEEGRQRIGLGRQGPGAADGGDAARAARAARRPTTQPTPSRSRSATPAGRGCATRSHLWAAPRSAPSRRRHSASPASSKASEPQRRIKGHDRLRLRRGAGAPSRPRRHRRLRRRLPPGRLGRDAQGRPGERGAAPRFTPTSSPATTRSASTASRARRSATSSST